MTLTTNQPRPVSRHSPERPQEPLPRGPARDTWNSRQNGNNSSSPTLSDQDRSPLSPTKRKRSTSAEGDRSLPLPEGASGQRRRLDSHAPTVRSDSPDAVAQVQQSVVNHSQPRTLPPVDRFDTERPWVAPHESTDNGPPREPYYGAPQHRDLLRTTELDSSHDAFSQAQMSEPSSTTRTTAAGVQVQVDPKKRKRLFANRTKTGCRTCRRRKKKCDEGKPECNNCQRGRFICEGYANKVPWPKNGLPKPPPPIVSKDRFPVDPTQMHSNHSATREGYTDSGSSNGRDGGRGRPIVVEEHDRPSAREWTNGWSDASRPAYSQAQQQHTGYAHAPSNPSYGRPSTSEQHVSHSTPAPAPARPHTATQYHYTQETMAGKLNKITPAMAEVHLSQQSMMVADSAGPPGPPPPHYAPPPLRHEKSEKAKMMNEEPFYPLDRELVVEREKCRRAVYAFNNTCNNNSAISDGKIDRKLRTILSANWNQTLRGGGPTGHLGKSVSVDTPFTCHYGYNLHIGSHVEIGTGCKFLDSGCITIGNGTTIGANVTINTVKTPTDPRSAKGTGPHRTSVALKVHIGKNVWIGTGCIIKSGVSIGENAIIDDGTVVSRDVPANAILQNYS